MKVEKIDHIGIAVKNLEDALKLYTNIFNLKIKKIEEFTDLKVKIAFLPAGEVMVELVQPTSMDTPLAKRIRENGEGLYHLALRVTNIDEGLRKMRQSGIQMRDNEPRPRGIGSKIVMSKPDSTNNVIIELVERSKQFETSSSIPIKGG
jgi:methylmalonyl-CoA/ethylmalonyl-CoA epimerase